MTTYDSLPNSTRVWIYQAQQPFSETTIQEINQHLSNFSSSWVSHNNALRAYAKVYHHQFIVLMVDESQAGASGCSIDKSVHFIQQLEQQYKVNLFDRMTFTYKEGDTIQSSHRMDFAKLYKEGKITDDTLVFDNLVNTKAAFDTQWLKPLKDSWHKRMV